MDDVERDRDSRIRTLDVTLQGGAPWGFSVKGGSEHRCPLTVARIEPGGKAGQSGGLQVDDIILSINNEECESHTEAVQLVKSSSSTLQLVIQRSGSDLHLRQIMKQTEYYKTPLQDVGTRDNKSPHIYDVQPQSQPPPLNYEKSTDIYDIKKSPDYDFPPSSKPANVGGVSRRIKKGEATNQPRPKSWHNVDVSQTCNELSLRKVSLPVAQQPSSRQSGQVHVPHHHQQKTDLSPSMDSLTVLQTFSARTVRTSNTKSMSNLKAYNEETEVDPGLVKRRVSEYISSSNRELSTLGKDKDFYFVSSEKRAQLIPYNPKFRNVELELQPAETYPKVAMATQLQTAQQRAFIGRVPDMQIPPESQQPTSQVVSYSSVHMPQRQYASSADVRGKYWDDSSESYQHRHMSPTSGHAYHTLPRMSPSPTPSDKREPPKPPQRGDSRNKTHQISEHMKSSSWPAPIANKQESQRNDNCTPNSVISPTDIPPVKLCSNQEQLRPTHSKGYPLSGDTEPSYSYRSEPVQSTTTTVPVYSSQTEVNRDSTGSRTFPGMSNRNGNKQESLFKATYCYVDDSADATETDTNSWFSNSQDMQKKQQPSYEYHRGSPPTRDNVERITEETDPLISDLQSYLQVASEHEECMQGMNPEDSSTGSASPVHQQHITLYSTTSTEYTRPHSQTLPTYVAKNENEKRLSRTSVSSLDSHSSNHRVKSPTNRLSSDEEEQNRKNSSQRTWKSPNDISNKKAVISPDEQWHQIVLTADPSWRDKYPNPEETNATQKIHIDEKLIRENAPGIRSPISPLMMEAVTTIEPTKAEISTDMQHKEITFLKTEGRDSGYEVDSENPFRSQQESPSNVQNTSDNFSSEDWRKLDNMESSGTSILSQLQRDSQTPFSQRYVNGEPIKSTGSHETKVEIKIDRPYSSPTSESNEQYTKREMSPTQSQTYRPQPLYQPKTKEDFLKEMKGLRNSNSMEARNAFFASQPQLSKQTGTDASSQHYHTTSLDLDTRMSGSQALTHSCFPPWKPEVSDESSSGVSHTRSHSYGGGFYPSHAVPSEPRFSRIDEEQGGESTESGSISRSRTEPDQRSASFSVTNRSHGSFDSDVKDSRRSTSDPKSLDLPSRKSSSDLRGRYPVEDPNFTSQHQYSKSDSERHRKNSAAGQWHKNSDPSGAIRKSHRVSDPDDKKHIKDVLLSFVQAKKGPSRSDGSMFGSDYSSMQSLDQFSQYSSNGSLHRRRDLSFDHSRQSSYSSTASHAHRDSGIVSPVESMWGPQSPKTSPPGVDSRQRSQQRPPVSDNHQRAASESTSPIERVRDNTWQKNSLSMTDDCRPTKKAVTVNRSASMSHTSRRRPQSYHDPRDRIIYNKDDSGKSLSRTETFSIDQKQNRQSSHSTSSLPGTGYRDNNTKPHWVPKDSGQQYPTKIAPSVDRSQSMTEIEEDQPPELPPKQVTYKSPASSYKVKEAQLKTIAMVDPGLPVKDVSQEIDKERKSSAQAKAVFTFPSPPSRQNQQRYPSPKTSPTHSNGSRESPPSVQVGTGPRPVTDRSPQLDYSNFELPPPPTPPAHLVIVDAELGGDLPSPPPEVLDNYSHFHEEDEEVLEETITQRSTISTHSAISFPPAKPDSHTVSPTLSPPTTNTQSPYTVEERLPVSVDLNIDPEITARAQAPKSELSDVVDPGQHQSEEVIAGSSYDVSDSGVVNDNAPSFQSRIATSPTTNRHAIQELDLDDEAGPIEVVEIVQTPTLSPRRGKDSLPGDDKEPEDHLVYWVLHSLNPQDSSLRELFQFPDEPVKTGSRTLKKMPHEKKEPQSPKRSECDVKSLTHALSSSLYLQISPAKALLLTRAKGMMGSDIVQGDSEELRKTKEELIGRIDRKVSELTKEKYELQEEINTIEDLGRQVTDNVKKSCKASSLDKYLMYVGDADRVTKLLLSLSRRLTKVNSVLNSLEGNDEEEQKDDLEKMHKDLMNKYEDAKGLKVTIDARHIQISSILQDHLSTEEYEDFCHFVPMRSRLRIMAQELDDRITLGEEQLQALKDSMKGERSTDDVDSS